MEEVIEKEEIEEIKEEPSETIPEKKQKKPFTIFGFTIWRLMAYFIIYSIAGYIIETLFGLVTKGVWESRKSFLYGPFCAIYGVGAVAVIMGLNKFKKNNFSLFFGGFLVGSIVEYVVSFVGEFFLHIKWWDYSNLPFNLNGRICVFYSLFWGVLAIFLMTWFHPRVDNLIRKIGERFSKKLLKTLTVIGIVVLLLDSMITGFALRMFFTRLVQNYDLELQNVDEYLFSCMELYKDPGIASLVDKYFNDEKMLKTFPNIKVTAKDGSIIFVSDILKEIQPYYFRLFTPNVKQITIR